MNSIMLVKVTTDLPVICMSTTYSIITCNGIHVSAAYYLDEGKVKPAYQVLKCQYSAFSSFLSQKTELEKKGQMNEHIQCIKAIYGIVAAKRVFFQDFNSKRHLCPLQSTGKLVCPSWSYSGLNF